MLGYRAAGWVTALGHHNAVEALRISCLIELGLYNKLQFQLFQHYKYNKFIAEPILQRNNYCQLRYYRGTEVLQGHFRCSWKTSGNTDETKSTIFQDRMDALFIINISRKTQSVPPARKDTWLSVSFYCAIL